VLERDGRQFSPSTARNREPILSVLRQTIPADSRVLEIAAGTGEHAVYFVRAMPDVQWRPTDPDEAARASIAAWSVHEKLANVLPPLALDVRAKDWAADGLFDAIVAINMIHIATWDATPGLFAGARPVLKPEGIVFLYGPFRRHGAHTAPSNAEFDCWLKARDPASGVRDLEGVVQAAESNGFLLREIVEMPANNLSVIFALK
jgi:cyclopropane fatty-acyl-phospholipid synthase-like methyltransferase